MSLSQEINPPDPVSLAVSRHPRSYRKNRFVYPVLSRRSKGISIGINLNPDKLCNFNCIYCQVDRRTPGTEAEVKIGEILPELKNILEDLSSGALFADERFKGIPKERLRVNDIAFSGDGEPSAYPGILALTREVIALKNSLGFIQVKPVMITNASGFGRLEVREALSLIHLDGGEVWAKLDAGSAGYYQKVCRSPIAFDRIFTNILQAAQKNPITIQSCFMKINGAPPPPAEIFAYCDRLNEVIENKGKIGLIQLYTVARRPAEPSVSPLSAGELETMANQTLERTKIPVETYP